MSRQHASPILVQGELGSSVTLKQIDRGTSAAGITEAWIQDLVQRHPGCLPIEEIDPIFAGPIPICTELNTNVGRIDNFLVTPSGLPVLVECKLWRNPEGRREVVGQILDYAKELARWSSSDLQREVARRCPGEGNPLLRLLKNAGHTVDEISFNDALTYNLRKGRFLLLIVGDGIREGVEAISEYLQRHLGLHFSLGLVEMPVFDHPGGGFIVTPRILARTQTITRNVVNLPDGMALVDVDEDDGEARSPLQRRSQCFGMSDEQEAFWAEFISDLRLDDPEQPLPRAARQGHIKMRLPAPQGSCWITIWRDVARDEVGLSLKWSSDSLGEAAAHALIEEWPDVSAELGGSAILAEVGGRLTITEQIKAGSLKEEAGRRQAFQQLGARLNAWVNVFRPRVRSAVADMQGE